jgi:hypothetical protein
MILNFTELHGEEMIILEVLMHIHQRLPTQNTGKIWRSHFSNNIGIFVENILLQNIVELFMVLIYLELMLQIG